MGQGRRGLANFHSPRLILDIRPFGLLRRERESQPLFPLLCLREVRRISSFQEDWLTPSLRIWLGFLIGCFYLNPLDISPSLKSKQRRKKDPTIKELNKCSDSPRETRFNSPATVKNPAKNKGRESISSSFVIEKDRRFFVNSLCNQSSVKSIGGFFL